MDGVAGNDPLRWFGAVVPKRHARRSVTRSLLKRQMRAAAQRQAGAADLALATGLWVVRLRAPFDAAAFKSAASLGLRNAARVELQSVLDQAARRVAGAPKAG